eukprot:4153142-Pyramimonas_sp.AAC.1
MGRLMKYTIRFEFVPFASPPWPQACKILSRFKSEAEVNAIPDAASMGIFVKDPTLRAFVKSQ